MIRVKTSSANNIPWYEKLHQNEFKRLVVNVFQEKLGVSKEEAEQKYKEFETISITDEKCCYDNGMYSFRYYVMNELERTLNITLI